MKRIIALALLTLVLTLALASAVSAAPPCNDGTGRGYAANHIVPLATTGGLGDGGHKPGNHQGFSFCLEQAQSGN